MKEGWKGNQRFPSMLFMSFMVKKRFTMPCDEHSAEEQASILTTTTAQVKL